MQLWLDKCHYLDNLFFNLKFSCYTLSQLGDFFRLALSLLYFRIIFVNSF